METLITLIKNISLRFSKYINFYNQNTFCSVILKITVKALVVEYV